MMKTTHNPEEYTISVKYERDEGEWIYVARVEELPDIKEFSDTALFARELALDSIATAQELCLEQGIGFPEPKLIDEVDASGRVTLRLPKSLHRACLQLAKSEGVSLNTQLIACISSSINSLFITARLNNIEEKISLIASLRGVDTSRHESFININSTSFQRKKSIAGVTIMNTTLDQQMDELGGRKMLVIAPAYQLGVGVL